MDKKNDAIRAAVLRRRDELGWTNYRLAKSAGVDCSDVARWLEPSRADHRPHISTRTLEPLLAVLGLKIKN